MEFTFLGTSAGTPTRTRNVTALALHHGRPKHWYLVDCGEATQHQLLRARYSVTQLQAIFITHIHGDHTFGLPGLLASASMMKRTAPLTIVAPKQVQIFVETALGNTDSSLGYELIFVDSEAENLVWEDEVFRVTTTALSHRVPCRAFTFTEKNLERQLLQDKLEAEGIAAGPLWGQLQQGQDVDSPDGRRLRAQDYTRVIRAPRKLVVAGDNDTPELLADNCQDAQVLIHEATYTTPVAEHVGPWPQHSTAARVAAFARDMGLPNLVLTHFSSRFQSRPGASPHIDEIETEARSQYQGQLIMARDFLTCRLEKNLQLHPVTEPVS